MLLVLLYFSDFVNDCIYTQTCIEAINKIHFIDKFIDSLYYAEEITYCMYDKSNLWYDKGLYINALLEVIEGVKLNDNTHHFNTLNNELVELVGRFRAGSFGGIGMLKYFFLNTEVIEKMHWFNYMFPENIERLKDYHWSSSRTRYHIPTTANFCIYPNVLNTHMGTTILQDNNYVWDSQQRGIAFKVIDFKPEYLKWVCSMDCNQSFLNALNEGSTVRYTFAGRPYIPDDIKYIGEPIYYNIIMNLPDNDSKNILASIKFSKHTI